MITKSNIYKLLENEDFNFNIENILKFENFKDEDVNLILEPLFKILGVNFEVGSEEFINDIQKELIEELRIIIKSLRALGKKDFLISVTQIILNFYNKTKNTNHFVISERDKKRIEEELKRIAIYEEYKILNPKRIAGETVIDNFINNIKIGGIELAMKYESTIPKDIKKHSLDFMKGIEKYNKNIKQHKSRSR